MVVRMTGQARECNAIEVENQIGTVSPGLYGGCPHCQSAHGMEPREFYHGVHVSQDVVDEGGFSWMDCELCGSELGGDRFAAHASKDGASYHVDVCVDCLMATANGEEYPDE